MKKLLLALFVFMLALPCFAITEDGKIVDGERLMLADCISIAVKNSPKIKKAELSYERAKAGVNVARSDYFPTVGAQAGFTYNYNDDFDYDSGRHVFHYPLVSVYLEQLIYNFGKTSSNIRMQKFFELAEEYKYLDSICETINDVKLKYFNVLLAEEVINVQKQNVEINERILKTTEDLFKRGQKTEIDQINAQVYLSDAKISLVTAQNIYAQALADLSNAMYIAGQPEFKVVKIDVFDSYDAFFSPVFLETPKGQWHNITGREREKELGNVQELPFTMEEAWDTAYKNSPDLKVVKSTLAAMKESVTAIKRQFYPNLGVRTGYANDVKYRVREGYNEDFKNNQFFVEVGLKMNVNGMKQYNQVKQANAIVAQTETDLDEMQQFIYYNVKKCYLNVKTAEKQIINSKDKVLKAKENLEITGQDYYNGKSNYIELQNARQNYNDAMLEYIAKINAYNVSLAKLEKATHRHSDQVYAFAENKISDQRKIDKENSKKLKQKNKQKEEIEHVIENT